MLTKVVCRSIASGFGSGYSPLLSGTAGSTALILVWFATFGWGLYSSALSFWLVTLGLTAAGLIAAHFCVAAEKPHDEHGNKKKIDPGYIVIDEWVGMLIALYGVLPHEYIKILIAFVLFRAFDIVKPGPVRSLEGLPREWGIMADDVAAGFLALLVRIICGI